MGFPVGAETVVLTGHVGLADGAAQRDTITLTPSVPRIVSTALDFIVEGDPITVVPDRSTGLWSVRLLANDATGFNPTGWTYSVTQGNNTPYSITLPAATTPVDLADKAPVTADPGVYDLVVSVSSLGGAATKNVGTTTGTVAAGDDARFGTIAGIPITGTPAAGKVPTLTSASAGTWQTPAGGGGATIHSDDVMIDEEIIVLPTAASWSIVTTSGGTEVGATIAAAVGDRVWFSPSFMRTGGTVFLDMGIKAAAGGVSRYISSKTGTPKSEGYAPLYPQQATFPGVVGVREFVVQAGEVDGSGNVKIVLAYLGTTDGNQKIYAGTGYNFDWFIANAGPAPA